VLPDIDPLNNHYTTFCRRRHKKTVRMSSRPMGWSIDEADKMVRLRAFKTNKSKEYDF